MIADRRVRVSGAPATKPSRQVAPFEPVFVESPPARFVSRAGFKLDGALDAFGVSVEGRNVLDVGSSTGGFSDCLLSRGAASVLAVDVGTNQLHERIRADPRIEVRERTDIRAVHRADVGASIDLVTADLSFISLIPLAAQLAHLAGEGGELLVLIKPQFEARRHEVDRGAGVIDDPSIQRRVVDEVTGAFEDAGAGIMGVMQSVLPGTAGNLEFFLHAQCGAST